MKNLRRLLIVVESKETGERFLHNPFEKNIAVPKGYIKKTQTLPLNEKKFGHLPLLTSY